MLYVSISDETSKVKGERKDEIMGENVGMISNGVTQRSHRTHGLRALIGGAQPYPWLVGPCGSAIKTGGGRGHESRGSPLPSTPPISPSDLGLALVTGSTAAALTTITHAHLLTTTTTMASGSSSSTPLPGEGSYADLPLPLRFPLSLCFKQ